MNLNALNTGLTQAPMPTATEANASVASAQRATAGTLTGEDFAAFLRNQLRALKNNERQDIAAAPLPPAPPRPERLTPYRPVREAVERTEREPNQSARLERPTDDNPKAHQTVAKDLSPDAVQTQGQKQDRNQAVAAEPATQADTLALPAIDHVDQASSTTTDTAPAQMAQEASLSEASEAVPTTELTTIPLSPSINIITTAQSQPDDQSVADFALAMGLDPSQVQALFGQTAQTTVAPSNPSTQQILAMNSLPRFDAGLVGPETTAGKLNLNTPVTSADFQALQASSSDTETADALQLSALNNLSVQMGNTPTAAAISHAIAPSTLAVLSMMDTELRAEDIDALQTEFDALSGSDAGGWGLGEHGPSSAASANGLPHKAAAVLANHPNMAQTFDKLSEKLATELASRMNDQLNAGEWKMKFALKPASLGLVDVQLEMRDGRLTAQFNADTALTQDLIQNGSQRLKEALGQLGMNNASVLVGQGQTQQQGQSGPSGQPGSSSRRDDNRVKLADDAAPELTIPTRPRHSNSLQFDHYA